MIGYKLVTYNGNSYYVCRYIKNHVSKLFVIDEHNLDKILEQSHSWCKLGRFVGYSVVKNKILYRYYLHDLIMNKPPDQGKNQTFVIGHINNNTHDNREANLQLMKKTDYYGYRALPGVKKELPKDCGIDSDDVPRFVYYIEEKNGTGEHFMARLNKDGNRTTIKSSTIKTIPLKDKLIEIKKKLLDFSKEHPELFENKGIIQNYTDEQINLMEEFNEIIKLSGYKCAEDNLMEIPEKEGLKKKN